MRVALVSDCYLPRLGGIEVQVDALAAALRRLARDVVSDVRVLTATPGPELPGVVRVLPPVPLPVPVNPWAGPGLRAELAAADVVHIHLGVVAPFASHATRLSLAAGRPTVVTWHSMVGPAIPLMRYGGQWRRWVQAGALPTAVSRPAADQVQAAIRPIGSRAERADLVRVLPNAIDPAAWRRPGGTQDHDADPMLTIVSATRFARRKRPLELIRLLLSLRERLDSSVPLRAVVAGDGPLRPAARALVGKAGASDWLELPGRLDRADLAGLYHRSTLYLSPVRLESFGLAALEARAAGLPVAGLAGSGLVEFVTDGVTGILARDDADLVARVARLLDEPDALARMARHTLAVPPSQTWPEVAELVVDAYREVVARSRVRASHHRPTNGRTRGM